LLAALSEAEGALVFLYSTAGGTYKRHVIGLAAGIILSTAFVVGNFIYTGARDLLGEAHK